MELLFKVGLTFICSCLWFLCGYGDGHFNASSTVKWACTCTSGPVGDFNYSLASNCSTSCNCSPEKGLGPNEEVWTCLCASAGSPQTSSGIQSDNCFTTCNCTSGSPAILENEKKHVSTKLVVAILLLCVVLTAIAFLGSLACYFYRKDRFVLQPTISSTDESTSTNSAVNLLSHRSGALLPALQNKDNSNLNLVTGFSHWASCLFRSKQGKMPGTSIQFSYHELEQATNKFSNDNIIGLGGSSNVYRGHLKDGRVVAVKRLKMHGDSTAESGFLSEIELISRLNHCHVVPLLGYCSVSQGKNIVRLLVFEYMINGNLRDCLDATHGRKTMDWQTRVSIALGTARGLEYLHEAAAPRILHRDVKSTNILLDDNYRPKITDLGMAQSLMPDDSTSCPNSPARMTGTFGYFAPEYAIVGKASLKSDVFSFGVVVLELITGRQPIQRSSKRSDESLVLWATPRLRDSKLVFSELPDPLLKGNFPEEDIQIMAYLARECLQWDPESRPTMSEVVQILSTISPDKSKWRTLSVNLSLSSSSHSMKGCTEIERHHEISECSFKKEEIRQVELERWQAKCSLPLSMDQQQCRERCKSNDMILSSQYMEKVKRLTSNAQNWQVSGDETVDLSEPRFESFVQTNFTSL